MFHPAPLLSPTQRAWHGVPVLMLGLAAALGTGSAAPAAPDGYTVQALRRACEGEVAAMADAEAGQKRDGGGWCAGYLFGVADALAASGAGGHPAGLCGEGYDAQTLVGAFVRWARAPQHQEFSNLPMLAGVQAALRARWPCS
jgi:hypothetical protein